jgi:hypothetical protein
MGARSRLEKQPTDFRQNICYFGDRTLEGLKPQAAPQAACGGRPSHESETQENVRLKSRIHAGTRIIARPRIP